MKDEEIKLKSILQTDTGIFGLGEDGVAYVYNGHKSGWARLNMSLMTKQEVAKKFKEKHKPDYKEREHDEPF